MPNRRTMLKAITAGALVPFLPGGAFAQSGNLNWSRGPDLPVALQEIYAAVHQGEIWIAGGLTLNAAGEMGISDRCFVYAPQSQTWREGPRLSEPMHHPQLVSTGDQLYLIGGFRQANGGAWSMRDNVESLEGAHWVPGPTLPSPLAETHAGFVGGGLHLAGGRTPSRAANARWQDHTDTDMHLILDPLSDQWTVGEPLPLARNSGAAIVVDDKLVVVGGRTVRSGNLADHHEFDPQAGTWRTLPPMPEARGGIAAAAYHETIHVFGGEYFEGRSGVFETVLSYDLNAGIWRETGPMPVPRHGLAAVTFGDAIYTIGGATKAGASGTSATVEMLHPLFLPQ